jgi:hypothetical protein
MPQSYDDAMPPMELMKLVGDLEKFLDDENNGLN